jgi:hypothetical protein
MKDYFFEKRFNYLDIFIIAAVAEILKQVWHLVFK